MNIHKTPLILSGSVKDEYSLPEISKLVKKVSGYFKTAIVSEMRAVSVILVICAMTVVILSIMTVIAVFINRKFAKISSLILFLAGLGSAILFVAEIAHLNYKVDYEMLQPTPCPFLLAGFLLLNLIGAHLKEKSYPINAGAARQAPQTSICPFCGAQTNMGASFCSNCGNRIIWNNPAQSNFDGTGI